MEDEIKKYQAVIKRAKLVIGEMADIKDDEVRMNLLCMALLIERKRQFHAEALRFLGEDNRPVTNEIRKALEGKRGIVEGYRASAESISAHVHNVAKALAIFDLVGDV